MGVVRLRALSLSWRGDWRSTVRKAGVGVPWLLLWFISPYNTTGVKMWLFHDSDAFERGIEISVVQCGLSIAKCIHSGSRTVAVGDILVGWFYWFYLWLSIVLIIINTRTVEPSLSIGICFELNLSACLSLDCRTLSGYRISDYLGPDRCFIGLFIIIILLMQKTI